MPTLIASRKITDRSSTEPRYINLYKTEADCNRTLYGMLINLCGSPTLDMRNTRFFPIESSEQLIMRQAYHRIKSVEDFDNIANSVLETLSKRH